MELKTFDDLPRGDDDDDDVEGGYREEERPYLEDTKTMRRHIIPNYPMYIGRDRKMAVCIAIAGVSRRHAKVFEKDNKFFIEDLGSVNGTEVKQPSERKYTRIFHPAELQEGTRVRIAVTKSMKNGACELLFQLPVSKEEAKSQKVKKQAEEAMQDLLGDDVDLIEDDHRTALKDCKIYLAKQNLFSMLTGGQEKRRIVPTELDLNRNLFNFLSLVPIQDSDSYLVSIEHPRIGEPLKLGLKITGVKKSTPPRAFQHTASITKISKQHEKTLIKQVNTKALICYLTSKLKE